jgi:hypothetical protein
VTLNTISINSSKNQTVNIYDYLIVINKNAAYKSWWHRLCKLPLNEKNNKRELDITINTATNNGYRKEDIIKLYNRMKTQQNKNAEEIKINQKWVTFT